IEPGALLRIGRKQPNPLYAKITKYGSGYIVIARIDRQTQSQIRIHRVQSGVLQRVRVQLGVQSNAAALMPAKVDDDAEALPRNLLHGRVQLFAAIAAPGSEGVTGEAFRGNPNQRHMAVSAIAAQIAEDQRKVLTARYYVVPVELE